MGEIIRKGNYSKVPYIIGVNNSEGHGMLTHDFPLTMDANFCREVLKGMLSPQHISSEKIEVAVDLVLKQFQKGLDLKEKGIWKRIVGDVMGDLLFRNPSVEMANLYSDDGNPTYMYHMTHCWMTYMTNFAKHGNPNIGKE